MSFTNFDNLKEMRAFANISQKEMATALNVSQSQVSRYEENPDDVPMKIVKKWAEICGFIEGEIETLDFGTPYQPLQEQQQKIYQKLINFPTTNETDTTNALDIPALMQNIRELGRKPRMGVFGHFDMGKSRLCNVLLGNNCLPTSYAPTTSVACILRHISDKPVWQVEDVWMMGKGFNIHLIDNEEHCKKNRIKAGNLASLPDYVTHQDEATDHDCYYAIIYVDSPILLTCDILDMPGYEHDDKDLQRTDLATSFVDIVLYLSTIVGFLDKNDLDYIGNLINYLPIYESEHNQPLDNVFIIATRADMVESSDERLALLRKASKRAFKHLDLKIENKYGKDRICEDDLHRRFFTFSADKKQVRAEFLQQLSHLLSEQLPTIITNNFQQSIQKNIENLAQNYEDLATNLENIINQRQKMADELDNLKKNEIINTTTRQQKVQKIVDSIPIYKQECLTEAKAILNKTLTIEYMENMIKQRYDDKKEAQKLSASYLSDSIQTQISQVIQQKSAKLSNEIDELLLEYTKTQNLNENIHLNFESKQVFISAVASLSTFGALATWTALATAGSNLGAYLLIPTAVSFLSGLGISISGGTATAVSLVAFLGGPVTVGIGIAVAVGGIFAWLTGSSWQHKMAKKLVELFEKQQFADNLLNNIDQYWQDTLTSFQQASQKTEQEFKDKIISLEKSITHADDNSLKKEKDYYIALTFFLKNLI